jgi:hypothetical protein
MFNSLRMAMVLVLGCCLCAGAQSVEPTKKGSSLYPREVVERLRANTADGAWAAKVREDLVAAAKPWRDMTDEQAWDLMFGATITRTWMVWSNGICPACKQSVPMYTWEMAALDRPWKVRCPHCKELFPKNDFGAYYRSGLDTHGIFDPAKADKTLLFNLEHPDANDPLHGFGVDDGEGYVEGDKRWRFIGAYLIYGQFKQAVLGGIRTLSSAYLVTGDPVYAHKAGILLDRVADVYPTFDYAKQGLVYEKAGVAGYVSTWHDTCEETRELVMAYDMIFEALRDDAELPVFLAKQAARYGLENPKRAFADIQRNIEDRILRDALNNRPKISSNYPRTEVAVAITLAVLGWPENRDAFYAVVDPMLQKTTAIDGVTGEKGLAGYSSFTIQTLAMFIAEFSKADPAFLKEMLQRQPRLHDTYRFFIDTHCLDRYYPQVGDTGGFACTGAPYAGMYFIHPGVTGGTFASWTYLAPSTYTLWRFYEETHDAAFVQVAWNANQNKADGLPYDLYGDKPEILRDAMQEVIAREGAEIKLKSVNKQQWHLGILRSGEGKDARAAWMEYDSGGGHGHLNALNLGLFAKGLDLMPEFGYPPVQFGGWGSERAVWYGSSAAHNTVVVDGKNSATGAGETTLWADGAWVHALRASAPAVNGGNRFERTVLMIDTGPDAFYLVDLFRVAGGMDHTKFMQSHFGTIAATGLSLAPAEDYGHGAQMRNMQLDPNPAPGWSVVWNVDDRQKLLPEGAQVRVRYTDFTSGAQAGTVEAWLVVGGYNATEEVWVPRVVVRRRDKEGEALTSTFVGVTETYETQPVIASMRRLPLRDANGAALPDAEAALEITLQDGRRDAIVLRDPAAGELGDATVDAGAALRSDADLCVVRLNSAGEVEHAAMCKGTRLNAGATTIALPERTEFTER